MRRRSFNNGLVAAVAAGPALMACAHAPAVPAARWREIEQGVQGRLGVAILDAGSGRIEGHRLDERFPMCSTFKWLAAAEVLRRVDRGEERLDRVVPYGREALVPYAPVTEKHVGAGLTLAALCEATITVSDNPAANIIMRTYGGPEAVTRLARSLGDAVTRLDRWEPELNEAAPGDPRDTTSPRAMARSLQAAVLGDALAPASRAQLARWLEATSTNGARLRKDLPAGWRMGSKTGTGNRGTANDVGVFWPPGRAPIVVAAYITESTATDAARNDAIAQVARLVTRP